MLFNGQEVIFSIQKGAKDILVLDAELNARLVKKPSAW